jgi:hypothetical protein
VVLEVLEVLEAQPESVVLEAQPESVAFRPALATSLADVIRSPLENATSTTLV